MSFWEHPRTINFISPKDLNYVKHIKHKKINNQMNGHNYYYFIDLPLRNSEIVLIMIVSEYLDDIVFYTYLDITTREIANNIIRLNREHREEELEGNFDILNYLSSSNSYRVYGICFDGVTSNMIRENSDSIRMTHYIEIYHNNENNLLKFVIKRVENRVNLINRYDETILIKLITTKLPISTYQLEKFEIVEKKIKKLLPLELVMVIKEYFYSKKIYIERITDVNGW